LIVSAAAVGGLIYAMPRNGEVQWYVEAPVLEWLIPIALVGTFAVGLGLMASGLTA
jgi:hypothetical protein